MDSSFFLTFALTTRRDCSVMNIPGLIALTVIPQRATATARSFVSVSKPPFDA